MAGDAVPIAVAGRLLGVTADRLRQLVRAGHVISPARGQVSLASAMRGYAATLRSSAAAPASAALARSQRLKAEIVSAEIAARKADLVPTAAATDLIEVICEIAAEHVAAMVRPAALRGFPADVAAKIKAEAEDAARKIEAAGQVAVAALTSGNLGEVEG